MEIFFGKINMKKNAYKYLIGSEVQLKHWWFRARNNILTEILKAFLNKDKRDINILDIGSGLGQLFPVWKEFGNVYGVEKNRDFAELSKNNYSNVTVWNDVFPDKNSLNNKYDLICMCDFLEHVPKTDLILKRIHKILNKDGLLLVTVPAYSWMWSKIDIESKHFKRYSRSGLMREIGLCRFKSIYSSYFMTFLFPLAMFIRKIVNPIINRNKGLVDFKYGKGGLSNTILYYIFNLEKMFIKRKIPLLFGLSILGVFKKI